MGEGEWNTEPVVPAAAHQLGKAALDYDDQGGLEMVAPSSPSLPSSPPSPRSTDPGVAGVSGYAEVAPRLEAE